MYHPIPTWKPILGGGYFPHFIQFTVYKTHTHIYSQAIHVPGWGWAYRVEPKRPGPAQGQLLLVSDSQNVSQLIWPCTSSDLRPMKYPAGATCRHELKRASNRAYVPNKHAPPWLMVFYEACYSWVVHHGESC